ncbi:MAG TPA: hypothetical protein VGM69_10155 [Chloroflexota bacterium]|jgi:hypothetical protein
MFNQETQGQRTRIDDLPALGEELSEENLRQASGGLNSAIGGLGGGSFWQIIIRTYCPASCTANCDTDAYLCD